MKVFVLGCDGYIGCALTQRLLNEGNHVIGIDNLARRERVSEMGSRSATPIHTPEERELLYADSYKGRFDYYGFDIIEHRDHFEDLIKQHEPDTVFHLAHQPSGPYSMISQEHATDSIINNILSTNIILWSIKEHCPNCHYITIGTTGEYDHYSNIDIEEGYITFEHKGRMSREMIYPRRPGSIYHASKTGSTYLIDYLARAWQLRCTDVQQSVVFGSYTDEIHRHDIYTRLDSDEAFGTVINRFIVQAVLGEATTIYGEGKHQRGFISLNDSIQAMMIALNNPAKQGHVQVWNQLSEWHSMNDIAKMVESVANSIGFGVLKYNIPTPRVEHTGSHYYCYVTEKLKSLGYKPTRTIEDEIYYTMRILLDEDLDDLRKVIIPKIKFGR